MKTSLRFKHFSLRASALAAGAGPYVHAVFVALAVGGVISLVRWQLTPGNLFLALYLAGWLGLSLAAITRKRKIMFSALALTVLALLPLAAVFLFRVGFVLKHGGMDCFTCEGSPLLFLYYWVIESAILFPGLAAAGLLWHSARVRAVDR
ncbi:MAG: hypothetical protein LBS49_05875 [Candidatus Accumulibacter sp.]|jgi:hypothetical protein|nr:hypothetical protein [Accumulibacter sp.]